MQGAIRDLVSRLRTASEESTETSGGGWRVKETSMWKVSLIPVELGEISGCNRAASNGDRWKSGMMYVRGGKLNTQSTVVTGFTGRQDNKV